MTYLHILMKNKLTHPIFDIVKKTASENNQKAFVIGGFVRDLIMNRPSKDIDIVVQGSGIKLAESIAKKIGKPNNISIFKRFGTAMLKYKDTEIEFVGARKESYSENSRKPFVEEGTLEDDQKRRDFTINALAISLNEKDFGKIIDPFDGINHIEKQLIKTPLEPFVTFSDDPLRMMRAIRFSSQLGFEIYAPTFRAIKENKNRIKIVSKERISDELNKILMSKKPSRGLKLLDKAGLLEIIFPELHKMKGIEIINGFEHKDNFLHTLQVVDNISLKSDYLWLRWAALLHDIGKPDTKKLYPNGWTFHGHEYIGYKMVSQIFKQMRLPLNEKMKYVADLVRLHLRPISLIRNVTDTALRRLLFEAGNDVDDLMLLCEADITSKVETRVQKFRNNFRRVRKKLKEVEERDKLRNWQPPISGDLIMKTFDMKPSRDVGILKKTIREAIINGTIPNKYDEAFQFLIKEGEKLGYKSV